MWELIDRYSVRVCGGLTARTIGERAISDPESIGLVSDSSRRMFLVLFIDGLPAARVDTSYLGIKSSSLVPECVASSSRAL